MTSPYKLRGSVSTDDGVLAHRGRRIASKALNRTDADQELTGLAVFDPEQPAAKRAKKQLSPPVGLVDSTGLDKQVPRVGGATNSKPNTQAYGELTRGAALRRARVGGSSLRLGGGGFQGQSKVSPALDLLL